MSRGPRSQRWRAGGTCRGRELKKGHLEERTPGALWDRGKSAVLRPQFCPLAISVRSLGLSELPLPCASNGNNNTCSLKRKQGHGCKSALKPVTPWTGVKRRYDLAALFSLSVHFVALSEGPGSSLSPASWKPRALVAQSVAVQSRPEAWLHPTHSAPPVAVAGAAADPVLWHLLQW